MAAYLLQPMYPPKPFISPGSSRISNKDETVKVKLENGACLVVHNSRGTFVATIEHESHILPILDDMNNFLKTRSESDRAVVVYQGHANRFATLLQTVLKQHQLPVQSQPINRKVTAIPAPLQIRVAMNTGKISVD